MTLDRLGEWIAGRQHWKLFGPFEASADPAESVLNPFGLETALVHGKQPPIRSKQVTVRYGGVPVNLLQDLGEEEHCVAFATGSINLSSDRRVTFRFRSDDGAKIWIDGEEAFKYAGGRALGIYSDSIQLDLEAGTHQILLKISQGTGQWAFAMEAFDFDGWPLPLSATE